MAPNPSESTTSERRYRHLFENLPICIFVVDLTVTPVIIVEVNRRTELVFGYTAAELIGGPAAHLVAEESRQNIQSILERVRQGETVTSEVTNRRRDGTTFPVRLIAALDATDTGRMIAVVEDITRERQYRNEAEAIDAERLRIAHEIHDGVAQNLAGLRFKSELWSHIADTAPPEMRAALVEVQGVLIAAIADIRRAIFALRPVDLEALGFLGALKQLVADFGDQNQLVAQLDYSESRDKLPLLYELPLFRIIQEGLTNIGRHARASSVRVSVEINSAQGVAVSMRDNGCGFDPSQIGADDHASHFGLRQMRERIIELNGTLDIHSVINHGAELVITLPPLAQVSSHAAD
ncbi:MAG: PAS domain-containing sensor histidine kinase [Chloroflexi bacterium]|nr:PAS domain-containing sensor histidine kinase [Chloroflexota bacterium]